VDRGYNGVVVVVHDVCGRQQPPDAATTMEVALGGGALEETTNPTNSNDLPALPNAAAPPPTNRAAAPPPRNSAAAPPPRNRAAATHPRSRAPRRSRTSVRAPKQEGHAGVAGAGRPSHPVLPRAAAIAAWAACNPVGLEKQFTWAVGRPSLPISSFSFAN